MQFTQKQKQYGVFALLGIGTLTFLALKAKKKDSGSDFNKKTFGTINLNEVAQEIALSFGFAYPAFDPRRWTEDEARAIKTIKTVPKKLMPELMKVYYSKYKRNLQQDFQKYLDSKEYLQVRDLFI